jgi:hypothetical protein
MIYTSIRAIAKLKEVWYEAKRLGPDGSEVVRLIEEAIEELTEEAVAPYVPSLNPLNEAELKGTAGTDLAGGSQKGSAAGVAGCREASRGVCVAAEPRGKAFPF